MKIQLAAQSAEVPAADPLPFDSGVLKPNPHPFPKAFAA
jgi:hypothetical protein